MWSRTDEQAGTFELGRDTTLRVRPGRRGVTVRAERGTLLVTQEGDREDHVLEPGEVSWFPRGGLVVALALSDARVVVAPAVREAPRPLAPRAAAA